MCAYDVQLEDADGESLFMSPDTPLPAIHDAFQARVNARASPRPLILHVRTDVHETAPAIMSPRYRTQSRSLPRLL
jgi:hypothetical protein